jgi:hypothetical protein
MTKDSADLITYKAFALAALLGLAGFLYHLWAGGVSIPNLLIVVGMALFASAISVIAAVMACRSKEE